MCVCVCVHVTISYGHQDCNIYIGLYSLVQIVLFLRLYHVFFLYVTYFYTLHYVLHYIHYFCLHCCRENILILSEIVNCM